ncbi:hypothetical protein [Sinosporangium siamense]|uniref:hypothetical protein n=1 Tax=Sinosporangium siamense TaxID=1367973 RepID=UPI001EF1B428|nr:hypothetical protein [Sinosporangium siamense]
MQHLHSFLVDKLSNRQEVTEFRSSIIYAHGQKRSLENLRTIDAADATDTPGDRPGTCLHVHEPPALQVP